MEEQEVKNFLRGEGENLTEVAVPTIDVSERCLADIADDIESEGLEHLIKHLGTIANTFKTENNYSCGPEVLEEGLKVIHVALQRLYNGISAAKGDAATLARIDRPMKLKYRRYLAVLLFLINKSFVEMERVITANSHNISIMAQQQLGGQKGKRGKKQQVSDDDSRYQFWYFWRPRLITEILKLVDPPMDELWEGNLEGYNFMRCITLAFCNALKNKTKRLRSADPETDEMFDILGILAAKHQEEKGILSRLIPLLKCSEDTATIIADGIARMVEKAPENQSQNMVLRALTEALDTYMTRLEKDTNAEKGFNAFLTQLAIHQPRGFMQSLAVLVQFLEAESPTVRNAVVVVAHELLKWTWREMKAEEDAKDNEDVGDERPNTNNWLNLRKKVFDEILLLHTQDVAAMVRTKSIQMLADLVKTESVIPEETLRIMKCVNGRILDKNNYPRKYAASLVVDIVKQHPHIVTSSAAFQRKRQEKLTEIVSTIQHDNKEQPAKAVYFIIKEFHLHRKMEGFMMSEEIKEKVLEEESAMALLEEQLKNHNYWGACEVMLLCTQKWANKWEQLMAALRRHDDDQEEHLYLRFFKATYSDIFPENVDDLELDEVSYIAPKKVHDCREFLKYIQCIYQMKKELKLCQPSLGKLLELGTTTDKKEAILFYTAASEAGYQPGHGTIISIINALAQLTDDELKDFVDPFKIIFIGRDHYGPHGVVKKLLELVEQLSENLVESLSTVIGQLYSTGSLNGESVKMLWDAFSLSTGGWSANASCSAAHILGIIGQIERKIITSNLNQLIEQGLGERGIENYELAKVTLQAILLGCRQEERPDEGESASGKGRSKTKTTSTKQKNVEEIRFPPNHDLFTKIVDLIEYGMKVEGTEQLDNMYPRVAELSTQIIYRMCTEPTEVIKRFLPNIHGMVFASENDEAESMKNSERILFRYMSLGKALLGAHITFYEQTVSKVIKERKMMKERINKKNKTANRQRTARSSVSNSSSNCSVMNQTNQDAATEMDLVMGHIGFDAEQDSIKNYVAKLLDQGFFRQFRVHVLFLCQVFETIHSVHLKVATVQALAKLMLVCESSVVKSLDTLIKLWNGNEPFPVKLEILRASIRLTVKFPNQMEKMNDCLTSGLSSKEVNVRKACMDYICYLALSDLLKVREQFPDTAACLVDKSTVLKEMSKDFINQIAEKDNVLQNCIPDVISRLSVRPDISQQDFQLIVKFLLQKIKKEKQLGGLVERIVGRFKGIVPVRTCQDTVYCLNQIQHNEKTLKVMKDNLSIYADKLGDNIVWDSFLELLNNFRKLNKPELKLRIDEWEKELQDHHEKCVALDNADKAAKRKNDKQPQIMEESSSDDEEEEEEQNGEEGEEDGGEEEGGNEGTAENGTRVVKAERTTGNEKDTNGDGTMESDDEEGETSPDSGSDEEMDEQ